MPIRVTDSSMSSVLTDRINVNRQRLEAVQERLATGRRINRPSDDPFGAEAVLRLRTSVATVQQFQETAARVKDSLQVADTALESHQQLMDRAKALLTQGGSDFSSASAKQSIAREIDVLREQMLNLANHTNQNVYTFGGTRQSVAPFDSAGTPTATPTSARLVQIEPGAAPLVTGVTADSIFSNSGGTVFAALANAAAALRGTGDPVADRATVLAGIDSLTQLSDQASAARAQIGASMNATDNAQARLASESFSYQREADGYEAADIGGASIELTQASNSLQATLQSIAYRNKGSLMDLIG